VIDGSRFVYRLFAQTEIQRDRAIRLEQAIG
jgi:hypothetical protein